MTLNYWKQPLAAVPAEVWTTPGLDALVLADTGLAHVPDAIGRLASLRMLDLGHNAIAELPETIGDLAGLTDFLYIHDNRLTRLPDAVARLTRLQYLNAGDNQLEALPEGIGAMAGLVDCASSATRSRRCRRRSRCGSADALRGTRRDRLLYRHLRHEGSGDRRGAATHRPLGYDGVELSLMPEWQCDPAKMSGGDRRRLRALLGETRLAVAALNEALLITAESRTRNLERLQLAAELAHHLAPGDPPVIETMLAARPRSGRRRNTASWTSSAHGRGCRTARRDVCFKPHAGHAIHNPARALETLARRSPGRSRRLCARSRCAAIGCERLQRRWAASRPAHARCCADRPGSRTGRRMAIGYPHLPSLEKLDLRWVTPAARASVGHDRSARAPRTRTWRPFG